MEGKKSPSSTASAHESTTAPQNKADTSAMRSVLIGGTGAVRKAIKRVFGVPVNDPAVTNQPLERHASKAGATPERTIRKMRKRERGPTKARVALSQEQAQRSGSKSDLGGAWAQQPDGIGAAATKPLAFSGSRIVKRPRASDELDAEYDRGKFKRQRSKSTIGNKSFGDSIARRL